MRSAVESTITNTMPHHGTNAATPQSPANVATARIAAFRRGEDRSASRRSGVAVSRPTAAEPAAMNPNSRSGMAICR